MPTRKRTNPSEKTYPHVVEVYQFSATKGIGRQLRRYVVDAPDSGVAFHIVAKRENKPGQMFAIFQGDMDHQGRNVVGYNTGLYMERWTKFLNSRHGRAGYGRHTVYDQIEEFMQDIKEHSRAAAAHR